MNFLEVAIRVDRDGLRAAHGFEAFMDASGIAIEPVTLARTRIARRAFAAFRKGRHRAGLDLGDCFAYALAGERGEPVLFKGDGFPHTGIRPALPRPGG